MASILPSRSHGRYKFLLPCKRYILLLNAECCSAEQHKYLRKKRASSSLTGSWNSNGMLQRKAISGGSSSPHGANCASHERSSASAGTFAACCTDRARQQVRQAARPLPRHTEDECDSQQQLQVTHVASAISSEGTQRVLEELLETTSLLLCLNSL